jgi:hypothetical protein
MCDTRRPRKSQVACGLMLHHCFDFIPMQLLGSLFLLFFRVPEEAGSRRYRWKGTNGVHASKTTGKTIES